MNQELRGGGDIRKFFGSPENGAYKFKTFGKKGSVNVANVLLPPLIKQMHGSLSHRRKGSEGGLSNSNGVGRGLEKRSDRASSTHIYNTLAPVGNLSTDQDLLQKIE